MVINEEKLKKILKKNNLTKSDLCCKVGVSSRTIAKVAKGENINDNVIKKIATFLNVDYGDIINSNNILRTLRDEKKLKLQGSLYHETQIRLTYNSNHIEGSHLTQEQTRYIFETQTIGELPSNINIDDIIEANNHFRCIDYIIDFTMEGLTEAFIINLQLLLMQGTSHERKFGAGQYKKLPNTVGGIDTTYPENVAKEMEKLLLWYNSIKTITLEDIVEFHYRFETIHPFQDGNGRTGRLIMFKECLKNNIVPFYIDDRFKAQYYQGLQQWHEEKNYLLETCRLGQDLYKQLLDYFRIEY